VRYARHVEEIPAIHNTENQTLQNAPDGFEGTTELPDADASTPEPAPEAKGHMEDVVVSGVLVGERWVED
jgi:hypothetical protein